MPKIRVLPPEAARLIAAGEVVDRPAAALRELLDNAIDSGATEIDVRIEDGGIALISVSDNGCGMDREDLSLSILPHATSKIADADDLLRIRTLGFRGEALASIASTSRLEIVTSTQDTGAAVRLVAGPGIEPWTEAASGARGTRVIASSIFERFPARRQFLKRPSAEAAICRQVFIEKALPHPALRFRWQSGSGKDIAIPGEFSARIRHFYPEVPESLADTVEFGGTGFTGLIVLCGPSFHRTDRRLLQVYVNRRRVQEWGISGTIEQAYAGFLPGGMKPCTFIFIEVEPALADFNIHPAKREVRFKEPEPIKKSIYAAIRKWLGDGDLTGARLRSVAIPGAGQHYFESFGDSAMYSDNSGKMSQGYPAQGFPIQETSGTYNQDRSGRIQDSSKEAGFRSHRSGFPQADSPSSPYGTLPLRESLAPLPSIRSWEDQGNTANAVPQEEDDGSSWNNPEGSGTLPGQIRDSIPRFTYIGRGLGPFLFFEMNDFLYILDQHAAHERILYNRLVDNPPHSQQLLVPIRIELDSESQDSALADAAQELQKSGFSILREGLGWNIDALPSILGEAGSGVIERMIESARSGSDSTEILRSVRASMACRLAVKDGDELDRTSAEELIAHALTLPVQTCPHGRPIWTRIARDHLFTLVGRTVEAS